MLSQQKLIFNNTSYEFSSPHDQCHLQVSGTVSWHKLRCCYSDNMLQRWVGGEGANLFLQTVPYQNFQKFFQELTWSEQFMWDVVTKFKEVWWTKLAVIWFSGKPWKTFGARIAACLSVVISELCHSIN